MEQKNKKSILIILEAHSARMLINAFSANLTNGGEYALRVVRSSKDALRAIQSYSPDAIILDDAILEAEGEEVLSKILFLAICPVILMTPYIPSALISQFMEMGGYGCVKKAFEMSSMNNIVARAIS